MRSEMVTTLKRQATRILADLNTSHEPVLITEQGKPAAYLINVQDYEAIQSRMNILEAVAKGEQDLTNERLSTHQQVKEKMSKWLK
ncbi:type II toxin-antitoxin system Phd/YefM family antitoxin [Thiomicrorhabdus sp. Kp2]|uniref:type II toxin-antitoxin system Phd/YefM family antitoxin n=1 Tax=Thiomicrorhabdus sp. Kp2 TaxID=1123518 RepID=UPI00040A06D5|nr:type II toxin-antitoxin system Phd/YefM family antitoxin [Thiomicrorhabdus sp. Kp2]